jgi:flagellar biosynthetic protein FlhB
MAEESQDRTEAATPRRLQRAREEGRVPLSRELPALSVLIVLAMMLTMVMPQVAHDLALRLATFPAQLARLDLSDGGRAVMRMAMMDVAFAIWPFLLAAVLVGAGTTLLQTGFLLNMDALIPDIARLAPSRGLKRIFGLHSVTEAIKGIAKLIVVGWACWHVISKEVPGLVLAPYWQPQLLADHTVRQVLSVLITMIVAQGVIAIADLLWVRLRHAQDLRMSREDVKQENKDSDGDPRVKMRLRQLRLSRARRRMRAAMKTATVVVTNPTHYAVALAYDRTKNAAPKVVAKGMDNMAARIREMAQEFGVPLVANPPLARALHRVELDTDIPPEHYQAVAELIAYVWRLGGRLRRAAA